MDTIDNTETPKRRIEDHTPDSKLDWTKPGAPAVPAAPAPARGVPLRAVASMCVKEDGISFFATPAAALLEPGHYMLSAQGAILPQVSAGAVKSAAPVSAPIASTPELQQLKALALATTPGPWAYQEDSDAYTHIVRSVAEPGRIVASVPQTSKPHGEATGRFIAAASPAVVLDLIARIERAAAPAPTSSMTSRVVHESEVQMENALAELRDMFPTPDDDELHALWMEAWTGPEFVVPYVKAQVEALRAASPAAASGDELPELPAPLEIVWPELHRQALGCGIEDRGIHDRYEAAEHGWECGVERAIECVPELLYEEATVLEIQRAAYELGKSSAAVSAATKPTAELHNIARIERLGDQSVGITFASARACSAFISDIEAAKAQPSDAIAASRRVPALPDVAMPEPTLYQFRTRADWQEVWSEWETCRAEAAADYLRAPLVNDLHFQVRSLYAVPGPRPDGAMPEQVYQVWQFGVGGWRDTTRQEYDDTHAGYRQIVSRPLAAQPAEGSAQVATDEPDQAHVMPPFAAPASQRDAVVSQLATALKSANLLLAKTFISTGKAMSDRASKVSYQIEMALAAASDDELSGGFREGRNTQDEGSGKSTAASKALDAAAPDDKRDARRYRILRQHVNSGDVRIINTEPSPPRQSNHERIDMLCDQLLARIDGDKQGAQGDGNE